MIEIRIESRSAVRRQCLFCGGWTDKDAVTAEVYDDGERIGYVVCPSYGEPGRGCLGQPADVLAARLRERIAQIRRQADELDRLADNLPVIPTQAEWRAAYDTYQAQWPTFEGA